ncbi:MAG: PepSY domain-containing protein [Clostridiales bacterium]|nr:PepSY domain-containing protein [Clostridiales bacterium]
MKMKKFFDTPLKAVASVACILAVLAILGVGTAFAVSAVAENTSIGVRGAQDAAFADAGVDPTNVVLSRTEFEFERGHFVYEVDFTADGMDYEYLVRASDGTIINRESEPSDIIGNTSGTSGGTTTDAPVTTQPAASDTSSSAQISLDEAKEIALTDAGMDGQQNAVEFIKEKQDWDDGRAVYDLEFVVAAQNSVYDYEVDASTGAVLSKSVESVQAGGASGTDGSLLSLDAAKEAAVSHAGLSMSDVSFSKAKLERDDGRTVYEIEFYQGYVEYDYTIDATTGAILEYDMDR